MYDFCTTPTAALCELTNISIPTDPLVDELFSEYLLARRRLDNEVEAFLHQLPDFAPERYAISHNVTTETDSGKESITITATIFRYPTPQANTAKDNHE